MKQKPQPAQAFPPSPKRAAIYIRVSSKKQEDGYSLEFQQEKCLAFIEEQGYVIAVEKHIFVDVHTGAEYLERPGLKAMREAAHHREFDILVMYDLTRFARDRIHAAIVREDLHLHNIITQTLKAELLNLTPNYVKSLRGKALKTAARNKNQIAIASIKQYKSRQARRPQPAKIEAIKPTLMVVPDARDEETIIGQASGS